MKLPSLFSPPLLTGLVQSTFKRLYFEVKCSKWLDLTAPLELKPSSTRLLKNLNPNMHAFKRSLNLNKK